MCRLTRNPVAVARIPLYIGLLSDVSIIFGSTTVGVCMFIGWQLVRPVAGREHLLFLRAALLTLPPTRENLFLFQEKLMPGIPGIIENIYAIGYSAVILGFLLVFWRQILSSDYLLLLSALATVAISVGIDTRTRQTDQSNLIEDSANFFGTLLWALYFVVTAGRTLSGELPPARERAGGKLNECRKSKRPERPGSV